MAELEKRPLGRTGIPVTVLGYGAMELRGIDSRGREVGASDAKAVLNGVLDSGITWIDTSIDYGDSEALIGHDISSRRNEFFLASKCGCIVNPKDSGPTGGVRHVYTRKNIIDGVNQSLKRMRTDHLDLVQFHGSPSQSVLDAEGAVQTLQELRREGKVRFIGSSSTLPNLADHVKMGVFDAFQIPYSALERDHERIITQAAKAGAGIIIRGGVARGEPGEGQGRADRWRGWDAAGLDDLLEGMTRTEFMLRFTISHPDVDTIIVGTLNPKHLAENVAAAKRGPLPAATYAEAKRRLDKAGVVAA